VNGVRVKDPEWTAMMYRVDETGLIDPKELASAQATMSPAQYSQEWLCDFSASTDNVLITIDLVSQACQRAVKQSDLTGLPKILGVDVARYGDDRSVIIRRQGLAAYQPMVMQGVDNMTLAAKVAAEINTWQPDAVFIDAGRGEGVIDRLRQLGFSVVEVNFGGKPANESYVNKRSEMWDTMAKWLLAGGAIPNHAELKTDLCTPTYKFDAANKFVLEPKDKIKERGLRSTDIADALALTFAMPVAPKATSFGLNNRHQADYDPFENLYRRTAHRSDFDPFAELFRR
jgi:hypothetical protein